MHAVFHYHIGLPERTSGQ